MQTTVPKDWICLTGYSNKYDVSVSTLRRRIKRQHIEYKLQQGKYFIIDQEPGSLSQTLKTTTSFDPDLVLNSLESLVNEIKSTYVNTLEEKDKVIFELQKENSDLKSLVNVMENDL